MLKKKVKTSLSIIAIIIITSIITSTAKQLPLAGKVITIDPGHPSYLFPNVWYNK